MQGLSPWLTGVVVGVGLLLIILLTTLVYRLLLILIGNEQAVQLILGLSVVGGLAAFLIDWVTDLVRKRN